MQKGGEGVQKACKNAYVINGRPHTEMSEVVKSNLNYILASVVVSRREGSEVVRI